MKKEFKNLLEELKENKEDYELYPTSKDMVETIWKHRKEYNKKSNYNYYKDYNNFGDVLDIGCGTCNFKKFIDELNEPFIEKNNNFHHDYSNCVRIKNYYVMEKSQILLDKLDAETIVLGTDFNSNTLIDKPVDTIFCNPPYSEYEEWTSRIIKESVCKSIYMIVPERWKNSEKIKQALKIIKTTYNKNLEEVEKVQVIGTFNFLHTERSARAKVNVIFIDKSYTNQNAGFDSFFDDFFHMQESKTQTKDKYVDSLKNELYTGKNKIEILCNGYNKAQQQLFEHFKVISNLDSDILETIGIQKEKVKIALKNKVENLKNIYWQAAFACLEEITGRLTSKSRKNMLDRFVALKSVDFNASNVYSLVIWTIKNSNKYFKSQMIDLYMAMSSADNIKNYKSNQKVFTKNEWGYSQQKHDHYTLDYRIICHKRMLPCSDNLYDYSETSRNEKFKQKISDICTVANNLGFKTKEIKIPTQTGEKGFVYTDKNKILFEFKPYLNGNVHIKFDKEFIKSLNVEVGRELNWIHSPEEASKEFPDEMTEGLEKYFNKNIKIELSNCKNLIDYKEN